MDADYYVRQESAVLAAEKQEDAPRPDLGPLRERLKKLGAREDTAPAGVPVRLPADGRYGNARVHLRYHDDDGNGGWRLGCGLWGAGRYVAIPSGVAFEDEEKCRRCWAATNSEETP